METLSTKFRKDTSKDHPLFGADPWDYFLGQSWRAGVPKTCGPRGYWFKVTFSDNPKRPYEWIWVDESE